MLRLSPAIFYGERRAMEKSREHRETFAGRNLPERVASNKRNSAYTPNFNLYWKASGVFARFNFFVSTRSAMVRDTLRRRSSLFRNRAESNIFFNEFLRLWKGKWFRVALL
jgi:hypothetical protein